MAAVNDQGPSFSLESVKLHPEVLSYLQPVLFVFGFSCSIDVKSIVTLCKFFVLAKKHSYSTEYELRTLLNDDERSTS